MGAMRGVQMVLDGEEPNIVGQEYADVLDRMADESEDNVELRRMAYTMLEIRQAIAKILTQPANNL